MRFYILFVLTAIFVIAGAAIPFINADFNLEDADDYSQLDDTTETMEGAGLTSLASVGLNILSMFFWTFGSIPWWLDSIFLIFRIVFWFIVVDILWIG